MAELSATGHQNEFVPEDGTAVNAIVTVAGSGAGAAGRSGPDVVAQALVKARWSDDDGLTTRINPEGAHHAGQTELAEAIQEGLAARAAGDEARATARLGRAVQLAAATEVALDTASTKTTRIRS